MVVDGGAGCKRRASVRHGGMLPKRQAIAKLGEALEQAHAGERTRRAMAIWREKMRLNSDSEAGGDGGLLELVPML